jgi:glutamate N-acetyltransferase/amino-acid N-acetyltransferase
VGVASTGITGRRIDLGRIEELAEKVAPMLSRSAAGSMGAAKAIMTTDTVPKQLSYEYKGLKVGAIAKGSGMIAPNMATMLCFITTNADLPRSRLQDTLEECVDASFNMMVVDGDTSPNDTVLLLSDRTQKCNPRNFRLLLAHLLEEMTKLLVKDAEGATKFLEVEVVGARTDAAAKDIAKTIVSSPLVKSAFCGENPNWGRMIAAASRKEKIKLEKIDLTYESEAGRAQVVKKGAGLPLKKAEQVLKSREIRVRLNLNDGKGSATAWGCDLTEEYVRINAEYN